MQWRWSADRRRWWKPSSLTKAWEWTKSSCAGSIILQMPRLSVANSSPIWVERLAARQKRSGGPVSPELFSCQLEWFVFFLQEGLGPSWQPPFRFKGTCAGKAGCALKETSFHRAAPPPASAGNTARANEWEREGPRPSHLISY